MNTLDAFLKDVKFKIKSTEVTTLRTAVTHKVEYQNGDKEFYLYMGGVLLMKRWYNKATDNWSSKTFY